ncbi:hypothetical protein AQUCO_00700855v1 [Aquilegia coerulea]|uniref:Uncharacterized protein n=1 Tax=Aquilegia coerulea TaxID=218851 RepID=A0A2G5EM59_AQUCA|nr:hypothetical protein AQUCO_00700855v1 [Aquilegia coerulea]
MALFSATISSPSMHHLGNRITSHAFRSGRVNAETSRVQFTPACKVRVLGLSISQSRRSVRRANAVCYASNTMCAAAETQTLTRKSSAPIVAPRGKEALPMLDDSGGSGNRGIGYTPYYRGDGRGGSGGGGGGFSTSGAFPWGDYWFYIFLFLLRFLMMNIIGEGSCVYKYEDGRNKPIRRYV